ncbi:MAG TPA: DUF308 domain-containing protein [Mycobacteriales bacterium]|jgi:uncharacterized membrane protein HdeD (DUF308 family)|nr:DUF308 domain-containing protein [Mycobacteriales bacterium]
MSTEVPLEEARKASVLSVVLGALLVAAGVLGLIYVYVATITSAILFAWLLLLAGVAALADAWRRRGRDGFWASAITGALNLAAAVVIFWRPAESILALTMLVAVFLLVGGVLRVAGAVAGPVAGAGWMALHGIVDILLAVLILATLPVSSFYVLGTLLSVSLLVDGIALAVLGAVAHRGLGRIGSLFGERPDVAGRSARHA